jgi:ion channel-forming bestrophin family protein
MMTHAVKANPIALLRWQKKYALEYLAAGFIAWLLICPLGLSWLQLPVMPLTIVGAAIGIFTSFRANQSYDRWWEGRKLWGRMINSSRHFCSQAVNYVGPSHPQLADELVRRHISYVHSLRCLLRGQDPFADSEFRRNLRPGDEALEGSTNLTHALLQMQMQRVRELADRDRLDERRLESFDRTLMDLLNIQGGCERIKGTPLPKGYGFIAELMIRIFAWMLPFAIVHDMGFLGAPMNMLVCLAFLLISEAGRVLEDPFSLFYNGLPLSSLSNKIERNLLERIGEEKLPPAVQASPNGILM